MKILCPCGNEFKTIPSKIKAGKGKYCSRKCYENNYTRRSGLIYNIQKENSGWFKKGQKGNTDSPSEKTKKKISENTKEEMKNLSDEKKKRIQINQFEKGDKRLTGENNPNWCYGEYSQIHIIRNLREYKKWRTSVFERDDYTCQECNKIGRELNAHHIHSFSNIIKNNHIETIEQARECNEL